MNVQIQYFDNDGSLQVRKVSAENKSQAISSLGLDEFNVVSVKKISTGISLMKRKITLEDQGILLTALASAQSSGKNTMNTLSEVLSETGFHYTPSSEADTLSKQLRELKFHELAVLVVESGINSGNLEEALTVAAEEIDRLITQGSNLASESKIGMIYHLIGLGLFFSAPEMAHWIVGPLVEQGVVNLPELSSYVFELYHLNRTYFGWILPLVAILVVIFRIQIFKSLRDIPLLNLPYKWQINRRAIQFNLTLDILIGSGYSTKVVPQKALSLCKKYERGIYTSMIAAVESGSTLSSQITKENWPFLYAMAIRSFENNILESQQRIVKNATSLLLRSDSNLSKRIAGILSLTGLLSAGHGILLLAGGIILPMMSISY